MIVGNSYSPSDWDTANDMLEFCDMSKQFRNFAPVLDGVLRLSLAICNCTDFGSSSAKGLSW